MLKAKPWNGKHLKGTWVATLKIDGVRALWRPSIGSTRWESRAGKPLFNIPDPVDLSRDYDCEVYLGKFRDTIRAVRTPTPKRTGCRLKKCLCTSASQMASCARLEEATPLIYRAHLYSLDPLDDRLCVTWRRSGGHLIDPRADAIQELMAEANQRGYEGLVLRQKQWVKPDGPHREVWVKVKPEETHDVLVTGAVEGVGKHKGRLGALLTAKGDVGTGFSDKEREELWERCQGLFEHFTIEVSCMQFTPDGKFRHPAFVRLRPDKIAEE